VYVGEVICNGPRTNRGAKNLILCASSIGLLIKHINLAIIIQHQEEKLERNKLMRRETRTTGVRGAARKLGCSLKWVYDLVYTGKLSARKVDGKWRISSRAIEEWLTERGK